MRFVLRGYMYAVYMFMPSWALSVCGIVTRCCNQRENKVGPKSEHQTILVV